MNELTLVDYGLLAIVLVSGILSLFRGFVREAVSLVSWIVAFWAAWVFGESFAEALAPWLTDPVIRLWVARLVLFVCVLLVGGLLGLGLGILLREGGLSALNRFIGIFFKLIGGHQVNPAVGIAVAGYFMTKMLNFLNYFGMFFRQPCSNPVGHCRPER